jgi:hypothetical protein
MARQELITALTFLKTIGALHSHLGPGLSSRWDELGRGVQITHDRIGRNILRDNTRTFFELIDAAWGIRIVTFKEGAAYLHKTFLFTLALVLSHHQDFWRGTRLFIDRKLARKIAQFPVADPQVKNLSSATGQAGKILYELLINHINSGKRSHRLTSRVREERSLELVEASMPE